VKKMAASIVTPFLATNKYYSTAGAGTVAGGNLTILAGSFTDDNGNAITAFPSYANFTLYINGFIQPNGVTTLTSAQVVIAGGGTLDTSDPITIELMRNF
jgi:hypothetical protein